MNPRKVDYLVSEHIRGGEMIDEFAPQFGAPAKAVRVPPPYSESEEWALIVVESINKLDDLTKHKFYELYDGFDLAEVIPGQPMKKMRINPPEICEAALRSVGKWPWA